MSYLYQMHLMLDYITIISHFLCISLFAIASRVRTFDGMSNIQYDFMNLLKFGVIG